MLIACQKHRDVHDLSQKQMQRLIHFYQAQWVFASYTPDMLDSKSYLSTTERAFESICPLEDAAAITLTGLDEPRRPSDAKAIGHVRRLHRLTEQIKKDR